ncbi:MAG: methylated-DNA--[protein]-cysteine S-methyltransferase [Blastocatellia bacterium]|nr:methylated-DNA--[protein]-cysteine S-methyltransferase [Blastocatellia bacterium]MBL8196128.1 methylated-DNA--[protein]-cysteine S-methyltransferase [Blastocatellia bacterium]MBN8722467.1 methylated-DNA--[protein]-cysteine S-methyltransferase [Acidobacteriota bacterium]
MNYYSYFNSPIGKILLTSDGNSLTGLYMESYNADPTSLEWVANDSIEPFPKVVEQLTAYFEGKLTEFDLPILMLGTKFQQQVWQELTKIPYGKTISYKELAIRIGNIKAVRAVGLANGRNPISIIVPCHRVIGANGSLTGYGGGLPRKKALLDLENSRQKALW